MHVGRIFCGLAKASDSVNHEILLTKLQFYGTQGVIAIWFKSYVTDRKQKTEIKSNSTQKYLFELGNSKAWSSPGVNFRFFAFHTLYK
jgi:hypothetical protein